MPPPRQLFVTIDSNGHYLGLSRKNPSTTLKDPELKPFEFSYVKVLNDLDPEVTFMEVEWVKPRFFGRKTLRQVRNRSIFTLEEFIFVYEEPKVPLYLR